METPQVSPVSPFQGNLTILEKLQDLDLEVDSLAEKWRVKTGGNPAGEPPEKREIGSHFSASGEGSQDWFRGQAEHLLSMFKRYKDVASLPSKIMNAQQREETQQLLAKIEGKKPEIRAIAEQSLSTKPKGTKRSSSSSTEEAEAAASASLEKQRPEVVEGQEEQDASAPPRGQATQRQGEAGVPEPLPSKEEPALKRRRQMAEYVGEHKGIVAYAGAGATAVVRVGTPLATNPLTLGIAGIAYGVAGDLARRTLRNWPQWKQRQRNWAKVSGGTALIGSTVGGMALFGAAFPFFPIAPALIGTAAFGGALIAGSLTAPEQHSDTEMGEALAAQDRPKDKTPKQKQDLQDLQAPKPPQNP
jgi:hypothetical protein